MTALLLIVGAGLLALGVSVIMSRASNQSALWNMAFAAVLLIGMILVLVGAAFVLTRYSLP